MSHTLCRHVMDAFCTFTIMIAWSKILVESNITGVKRMIPWESFSSLPMFLANNYTTLEWDFRFTKGNIRLLLHGNRTELILSVSTYLTSMEVSSAFSVGTGVAVVTIVLFSLLWDRMCEKKALRMHFPLCIGCHLHFLFIISLSAHFLLLLGWNCALLKLCSCCREVTNVLLRYPWWNDSSLFLFKSELKSLQIIWTRLLKNRKNQLV